MPLRKHGINHFETIVNGMGTFAAQNCTNAGGKILTQQPEHPIDRQTLDAQTFGDPDIRREVLMMLQAELPALLLALNGTSGAARSATAHRIKGSALAVGAVALASAAAAVDHTPDDPALVLRVETSARAVIADIELLLGR
jgi:HPt (histidine-containing phosphotransfer) domain-containing protein